jgi:acetyl-CoA carboxylase biotin carboxylase subunit
MFKKVLIANRGEIALRVARACRELGINSVGVYSTADRDDLVLRHFDEVVHIGPPSGKRSYLNAAAIIEAASQTGADAVHPGYGFLSEDPDFAEVCVDNDLTFIGPRAEVMGALGDKSTARRLMLDQGLPLLPGSVEALRTYADAKAEADAVGYPVIIKAVAGGGGKGMSVVHAPDDLEAAYRAARATAAAVFGDGRVYLERYVAAARHVEVQVLCDHYGNGIHLGTRDCSVQRRHQKLIEEGPAPALSQATLDDITATAVRGALAIGFTGAGTFEFLVDENEKFYFMEVNARLQVEHTVSEMITGVDLVHEQLHVAADVPLRLSQQDIEVRGHAIECRVNGEDPDRDFAPTAGLIERFIPPGGPFTRVDTHAFSGYRLGPHYDSLLAKVIVWAPDRIGALNRMERALGEFEVSGPGVRTTIPMLRRVLADFEFRKAEHSTAIVPRLLGN